MRSTPAFLMASIRGLVPGAGTGTSARTGAHNTSAHSERQRTRHWDMVSFKGVQASGSAVTMIGEASHCVKLQAAAVCANNRGIDTIGARLPASRTAKRSPPWSLNHFIRPQQKRLWNRNPKHLGG